MLDGMTDAGDLCRQTTLSNLRNRSPLTGRPVAIDTLRVRLRRVGDCVAVIS